MNLTIDGVVFDVKAEVQRVTEVRASDISGTLLNGVYFNDVMGTYLQYDLTLKYPLYNQGKYAGFYELFTDPVAAHTFLLPYNQETVEISARVESVTDQWVETDGGHTYWQAFRASIISNAPTKEITLAESIARGLPALPDVYTPVIGDTYTYTAEGWEATSAYADADATYY